MSYRKFSSISPFSNELISDRLNRMDDLFNRLVGEKSINNAPNYDLLKVGKNNYEMTISVPGFEREELVISVLNNQLLITGKSKSSKCYKKEKEFKILHQGIKKGDFSLSFDLEHKINIKEASMKSGLLILKFTYEIPEQEKPKNIEIK